MLQEETFLWDLDAGEVLVWRKNNEVDHFEHILILLALCCECLEKIAINIELSLKSAWVGARLQEVPLSLTQLNAITPLKHLRSGLIFHLDLEKA